MDIVDAKFISGATNVADLPAPAFAEIAFAGRSNVGKSSLINNLVKRRKLVRTSSTPGCTRAINIFRIRLRGDAELDFVDLPGYGYANRSKAERRSWGPLIENFLEGRPGLRATEVIADVRRGLEPDDVQLLEFLDHLKLPAIIIATKLDKLPKSKQKPALQAFRKKAGRPVLGYSAVTGDGRDALWDRLLQAAAISPQTGSPQRQ